MPVWRDSLTRILSASRDEAERWLPKAMMNPALWFDKYFLARNGEDKEARQNHVHRVVLLFNKNVSAKENKDLESDKIELAYAQFFKRWKEALEERKAMMREAETLGRLSIHLGAPSVLETSVLFKHPYGIPYIPGRALKGLAARFARLYLGEAWRADRDAYQTLFGTIEAEGMVTFYDALPIPESVLIHSDVMNVHHSEYYRDGKVPPADWDSPTPIPFISVTGRFLIALEGQPKWVRTAFQILRLAFRYVGVGAKTSSGYGRLRLILDKDDA
ncbi:type III-B CRISPR module RAMP protein Cmr6 [Hydrogenibacillus sp. N12]|uniref:type III-B CRISPR module RAMP protein Cmr6 n=1 Tax=Hydrogenibacillus sp. N12 TaxID=2866627 RepID=UPI001C7CF55C|nr:type III-B CRISPR module RAMP protein Cmr6 [Hydrogenibacillus sp. N12]QZA33220.1 type III-B CRISPR module RAMP protein Cmr6 [Hydrogenibacillus sp. N12]